MCCSIVGPLNSHPWNSWRFTRWREGTKAAHCAPRPCAPERARAVPAARPEPPGQRGRCRQRLPAPTGSARPAPLLLAGEGRFYPRGVGGGVGGLLSDVLNAGLVLCLWKDSCKVCVVSWKEAGTYVSSFAPGPGGGRDSPRADGKIGVRT